VGINKIKVVLISAEKISNIDPGSVESNRCGNAKVQAGIRRTLHGRVTTTAKRPHKASSLMVYIGTSEKIKIPT
jgi:hypothetical protein